MKLFDSPIRKIIPDGSRQEIKRLISPPLYRNSLYLMADSAIVSAFGFLFWLAAARLYSESDVGSGSAIISAINLLIVLSTLGLSFSIIRFLPKAENPSRFINSALTAVGVLSLLSAVVFIAGLQVWSPALLFLRQSSILLPTFIIMTLLMAIIESVDSIFIATRKARFVLFNTITLSSLRIILLFVMAFIFRPFGIVTAWGLALAIVFAISAFFLIRKVQEGYRPMPALDIRQLKSISRYSMGNYTYSLLSQAPNMILPLIVVNTLGADTNAYFYIAWTVSSLLSRIPWAISLSLFAEGSHSPKTLRDNTARAVKFTFLLLIPMLIIFLIAAKWILLAFGSGYLTNGLQLLWLLCLANLPRAVNHVYVGLLRAEDKVKEMVIIQSLITVLTLSTSIWAIRQHGILGVGYVWLIVQGIMAIVIMFRMRSLISRPVSPS